jgi:precorrin-6Y C5,15-methyltransferase (decarboxylating)
MPRPGEVLWDVGAGRGIDRHRVATLPIPPAGRSRSSAILIALKRIRENAGALGVPGLEVLHGEAPAVLASLPRPHAAFVGGGGTSETSSRRGWHCARAAGWSFTQ